MQKKTKAGSVMHLKATGKSGILDNFKATAAASRNKSLIRTDEDSDRVKNLIKDYDSILKHTKTQTLLKRGTAERKHLSFIHRQIKIAIIRQGYISHKTLARFKFRPADLIEKITYRELIEKFAADNIISNPKKVITDTIFKEAKKGESIDVHMMSDEYNDLYWELKQYDGSGEFTDAEISAGWLHLAEIKNKDKSTIYNKKARIENLCFYLTYNPSKPDLKKIDYDKLISLSTSNLERIISFYCQKMNAYNAKRLSSKRRSDKRTKTNSKYVHKKGTTADQKRDQVKDLKSQGKTQLEVAAFIGCSERTVRTYWK